MGGRHCQQVMYFIRATQLDQPDTGYLVNLACLHSHYAVTFLSAYKKNDGLHMRHFVIIAHITLHLPKTALIDLLQKTQKSDKIA